MEISEELKAWLQQTSKPYAARLEFATRLWHSMDFTYPNKSEIIIKWLAETLPDASVELPVAQLEAFFKLRAQPGLVSAASKSALVTALLQRVESLEQPTRANGAELLQHMLNFELLQDVLRADYLLLVRSYAVLFKSYERHLLQNAAVSMEQRESEFALPLLKQLREYVQRAQNLDKLCSLYTKHAVQPLVELLLQLRQRGLCCMDEFVLLEKQFTEALALKEQLSRTLKQPLHVRLLVMESAMARHRLDSEFIKDVLEQVFVRTCQEAADQATPQLSLTIAAYTLEALRKHDISLQFHMDEQGTTALSFLGQQLLQQVREYRKQHLREVLLLLCAALRLNPLLLEGNVYQLTVWLLTTPKQSDEQQDLYSEYLMLLLDMFRRLSHTEQFIMKLLKALREWLSKNELETAAKPSAKNEPTECSAPKRSRLSKSKQPPKELQPYLDIIFQPYSSAALQASWSGSALADKTRRDDCFARLAQTWPSHTAGTAFSKLVSQLMSNPSIVIWRTLLHALAELLEDNCSAVLPANMEYCIELQAALLSQYFLGTRLAEQLEQHQLVVEKQLAHTGVVLQQFGRQLLRQEHNRRSMNAFLELVRQASNFELLLAYYWPDGLPRAAAQLQLHSFLPAPEWKLIKQRVHNFGKSACRQRLQQLELQLAQSGWLLQEQREAACTDAVAELLPVDSLWRMTRAQKQQRLQPLRHSLRQQRLYCVDAECVELLAVGLLQDYATALGEAQLDAALLPTLQFDELSQPLDEQALHKLASQLRAHSPAELSAPPAAATEHVLAALQQLPLSQLATPVKSKLWLLLFALYRDLSSAQQTEQAQLPLQQMIDLLHFGKPLPICSYFPQFEELLQLLPMDSTAGWRLYERLFACCIRRFAAGSEGLVASCVDYLRQQLEAARTLAADDCRLLLLGIQTLSGMSGARAKRAQQQLQPLLEIYEQFVTRKFKSKRKEPAAYKQFVDDTLSGYATYVSAYLRRQQSEQAPPIDDNFRRICKIYIGHSLNYRSAPAINLLNVALTQRQQLHLDQDEIEFVLNSYWRQLNADIQAQGLKPLDINCIEPAVKLIIGYKTNEDFLLLLRHLTAQINGLPRPQTAAQHTSLQNVLTLLALFAKCSLSKIKGAILNEQFELIIGSVALRLPANSSDSAYSSHVLRLLQAQSALANNRTVPLTGETLDCMLAGMLDIDIKRYVATGGSWADFVQLHAAITENCIVLLRQRGALMAERMSQLLQLFQDLLQAVVGYRSERQQQQDLNETELDGLAELALKLSTLMASITSTQALAIKRVAPFLLIFSIRQMVGTERPTTLFEQIKVHVQHICHELIGVCDHRSGHFILRASSEAGSRMYQSLVKEHDKYHKFKGKV